MSAFLMVGPIAAELADVKTPDKFDWGLQDVSSSDSGRVNDASATMYKNRVAQKRKISLGWNNPSGEETAAILQAFDPEYVWVRCLDPKTNTFKVLEFYVGDRSAPLRQFSIGGTTYRALTFDIIER